MEKITYNHSQKKEEKIEKMSQVKIKWNTSELMEVTGNTNIKENPGFKSFEEMLSLYKSIIGSKWNKDSKVWNVPKSSYHQLISALTAKQVTYTEDSTGEDQMEQEMPDRLTQQATKVLERMTLVQNNDVVGTQPIDLNNNKQYARVHACVDHGESQCLCHPLTNNRRYMNLQLIQKAQRYVEKIGSNMDQIDDLTTALDDICIDLSYNC